MECDTKSFNYISRVALAVIHGKRRLTQDQASCKQIQTTWLLVHVWRSPHLGVLPREEALFKAAVHGERDEGQQPPVLQQSERGQEGVAERLPVPTKLAGLIPVNVVQKHRHNEHGQHTHAYRTTQDS